MVSDLAEQTYGQEGRANNNVEPVKACCYEECSAVDAVGDCKRGFVVF